ncbi:MAG: hypothetical protein M5U28_21325 [Sandaracinaceae bacterium]|nr:hypothetical protein [Sandaracinaceae bacterium]
MAIDMGAMAMHAGRDEHGSADRGGRGRDRVRSRRACCDPFWTTAGKPPPIRFEFKPDSAVAFSPLGKGAKRDTTTFSYLLRLALAHTSEKDGWFVNAPDALGTLPGWENLSAGTRTNKAARLGASTIIEFVKGRSGPRAAPSRSRLKGVSLKDFDADAARTWLGMRDLRGMRDMNHGLPWGEMARLALMSSTIQYPYCDAAIELCRSPAYRGWSSDEVRLRVDKRDLEVARDLQKAESVFPEARHGGSRRRLSLTSVPLRPLIDDRSVQEITAIRSEHAVFAELGLMLAYACFDEHGTLVGPGGTQSGRTVIPALPLGASGTIYNMVAEIILETSDGQIIFCRRPKEARYAADTWSASIEEQLDDEEDVLRPTFDEVNPIFNCALRGICTELRVTRHEILDLKLLSIYLGALIYSAGMLFYGRLGIPYATLRRRVPQADDAREHSAVAASPCTLDHVRRLYASDTYAPERALFEVLEPDGSVLPAARWHPASRLRLYSLARHKGWEFEPLNTFCAAMPEAAARRRR